MRKSASYNDTLIYAKNEKIYNKSMSLTDNDNNYVVEDEISRTKDWRNGILKRIKQLQDIRVPPEILKYEQDRYEESLTMTYSEYENREKLEHEQEYLIRKKEYLKDHSAKKEINDFILEKFDKWFEKYKDSEEHICDFGHRFEDPWFWGKIVPWGGADTEFYEHILTPEEQEYGLYKQVFHYCESIVNERIKQKEWSEKMKINQLAVV